jgi:very-short-patch-repair endonuclease
MAVSLLCSLGHIATTRQLQERGVSAFRLRSAVEAGRVKHLRRGVYACTHVPELEEKAALAGGAASCISILREAGVWAGNSRSLHLQVAPGRPRPDADGLVLHWEHPRFPMASPWRAGRMQAMWRAIHCLDEENSIAALESALHLEFLTRAEVGRLALHAPRRLHPGVDRLESNSGSGNETIVRRRLQSAGYSVVTQAYVPGMGHEDLLVEDCVGLDVDGREWHGEDRYEIDHARDLRVEGFGRHVLRPSTSQIHVTWPTTLAVIERVVGDAIRERDRRAGRILIDRDAPF